MFKFYAFSYGDLLQCFEEFSLGDSNFSLILLIGAYMNNYRLDGLLTAQALWSPRRNIARQILIGKETNIMVIL
jgi:hypothetical protein